MSQYRGPRLCGYVELNSCSVFCARRREKAGLLCYPVEPWRPYLASYVAAQPCPVLPTQDSFVAARLGACLRTRKTLKLSLESWRKALALVCVYALVCAFGTVLWPHRALCRSNLPPLDLAVVVTADTTSTSLL